MIEWFASGTPGDWNAWEWIWLAHPASWEWLPAVLLGAVFLALSARGLRREPKRGVRVALWALRLLALAGIFLLWLQPAIQLQARQEKKNTVVLLADRSRSMSLPSGVGRATRYELVQDFLRENGPALQRLGQRVQLKAAGFDEQVTPTSLDALLKATPPKGEQTALYTALRRTLESYRPGELAGVLLLSDGVVTTPAGGDASAAEVIAAFHERGVPVHVFAPGGESGLSDQAIRDVRADGFAFIRNKITVEAELTSRGLPPKQVIVTLSDDTHPVASQSVLLPDNGSVKASFTFTPERVGRFLYTLSLPDDSADAIPANNTRRFMLDVLRDKIRVLHVVGHPSYDEQFLRRYLKNNPNVDLISFFILRTNSDLMAVNENELSLIPFPTDELFDKQLGTFDLLIFQDFTYRGYQMEGYLGNIQRYVQNGGAFLMIGGEQSFGLGGYGGTPIEPILPASIASNAADAEPFVPVVPDAALTHPILQLVPGGAESVAAVAKNLPALWGLNLGLVPRAGVSVLMEHPRLKAPNGQPAPVLMAWQAGRGRVVALAADASWRWAFADAERGGDGELYRRFYNNTLRWLMKDPELTHLSVKTDTEALRPGAEARVELRYTDPSFAPKPQVAIHVRLTRDDTKTVWLEKTLTTDEAGAATLVFKAPDDDTTLHLEAAPEGADAASDTTGERQEALLVVGGKSAELDAVAVDNDSLKRLAKQTGGRFFALPAHLDDDLSFPHETNSRVIQKHDIPLWDNSATLAIMVLLFAAEWFWRKRRRLT